MVTMYRTGRHWGVTIVREGEAGHDWLPVDVGHAQCPVPGCVAPKARHHQLVAVVVNGDQALAERICELLNAEAFDPDFTVPEKTFGTITEVAP